MIEAYHGVHGLCGVCAARGAVQAMDSLATFYEACAQIEIDEYRDYEKALQAMHEAARHAGKIKGDDMERDARVAAINNRIGIVETFVRAHTLIRAGGEGPSQEGPACAPPARQDGGARGHLKPRALLTPHKRGPRSNQSPLTSPQRQAAQQCVQGRRARPAAACTRAPAWAAHLC